MGAQQGPQSFMKRQRERQKQLKQMEKLAQRRERSARKRDERARKDDGAPAGGAEKSGDALPGAPGHRDEGG